MKRKILSVLAVLMAVLKRARRVKAAAKAVLKVKMLCNPKVLF